MQVPLLGVCFVSMERERYLVFFMRVRGKEGYFFEMQERFSKEKCWCKSCQKFLCRSKTGE